MHQLSGQQAVCPLPGWKLEDAKSRFSDLVRRARDDGPQLVTVRGKDAVVVLSVADYARLAPATSQNLLELFADSPFGRLDSFDTPAGEQSPFRDPQEF